ncbi:MAG: arylsulfatase, partial [Clostridia bacterium]|nr:arylsulfatase [Clostridia bacterium]
RDVMPTQLDYAGLETPQSVEGISMRGDITREYLHGEHEWGRDSNHWVVTETDKYIWYPQTGVEQYFRLDQDPREERNLIGCVEAGERIGYLRSMLDISLKIE